MAAQGEDGARAHTVYPRPTIDAHRKGTPTTSAQWRAAERALDIEGELVDETFERITSKKIQVHLPLLEGGIC